MSAWRTDTSLSIFKWGFHPTTGLNPRPGDPGRAPAPRAGLRGRGEQEAFCQGGEPLLKTPPNAKQHTLPCEFYRSHKYSIAHPLCPASPGSRCYLCARTVIRQTRPETSLSRKHTATIASSLIISKVQGGRCPMSEDTRRPVVRGCARSPDFSLIPLLSEADNGLTKP